MMPEPQAYCSEFEHNEEGRAGFADQVQHLN